MKSRFAHRRPDRPDWKRYSEAPLTTASDLLSATAKEHGSPRSSVDNTPTLWRKLEHRIAVNAKDQAKLDKAIRLGDMAKAAKLRLELDKGEVLGREVLAELEARGALAIGTVQPHIQNWRAKGTRKHPERKASPVRSPLIVEDDRDADVPARLP